MNSNFKWFYALIFSVSVTGCSYIRGFFPDKHHDYQLSQELPVLKLPSDLNKNAELEKVINEKPKTVKPAELKADELSAQELAAAPVPEPESEAREKPVELPKVIPAELVRLDDGETRLHIGAPVAKSWYLVSKALSRNSLEVTNRDDEKKLFEVQYGFTDEPFKDSTLWDQVVFVFAGAKSNEKAHLLKLIESGNGTDVLVYDKDEKPLINETAVGLLKLIQTTLLAEQTGKDDKAAKEAKDNQAQ
ncbi:MAG: hypothetical protein CTY34_09125 [Methylobacter sp.]|nr:MAG: hypothetical protein CTY34_09125 [Methylobacter sp.]PPD03943.1 MAG: hypothetical protein CTY29_07775 [Methylobacter sp.]PPD17742.1 MAG: hypothetical protein CTY24_14335 [Methylobacter sp.]PPD33921.1 MAG: hypothetical protein CTY18_09210 [Methylomonas sp.]